ncbi:hypothetical protein [Streptosporangium sp. NPDC002524]|uniref:hypothetical protein n=1 Tax=Streptosporangium sp. NPDC002524 TaxID=3154537 RepID=UPI00331684C8
MKFNSQVDFLRIPAKGLVPEHVAGDPVSPADFQLWANTISGKLRWKVPGGSALNVDDVADAAITNAKIAAGAAIDLSKLAVDPLARGNHTGTQVASTISNLATTVKAYRLDEFATPTAALNAGGQRWTNGATPTSDTDLVIKSYVDAAVANARAGIAGVKDPVRVASLANINLASPGATVDGVTMVSGDRFLATAQTTTTQNGVYTWSGASVAATRATDADAAGEVLDGTIVSVAEGTSAGSQFLQQATPSGAPGAWAQQWTVYSTGGTSYIAGDGLQLTGNSFAVDAGDASIVVDGSGVKVGLAAVAQGGTGATTAAGARANLGVSGKFAANVPALSAGVWTSITHSLGTEDIVVGVRETATDEGVLIAWKPLDNDTVQVRADLAVAADALRIVVVG